MYDCRYKIIKWENYAFWIKVLHSCIHYNSSSSKWLFVLTQNTSHSWENTFEHVVGQWMWGSVSWCTGHIGLWDYFLSGISLQIWGGVFVQNFFFCLIMAFHTDAYYYPCLSVTRLYLSPSPSHSPVSLLLFSLHVLLSFFSFLPPFYV